jgi:hypothetical protein
MRDYKWTVSDIPRGLATGSASEYNQENIPCIEVPCGPESGLLDAGSIRLAGGSLQFSIIQNRKSEIETIGYE